MHKHVDDDRRKREAAERQKQRDAFTADQQLVRLDERPGLSLRERGRLGG